VTIPTYSADGTRLRDYSSAAVERLCNRGAMVVERNKRGRIVAATFRPDKADRHSRSNPVRASIPVGTYYSYEESIADKYYVWQHRELVEARELRQLFGDGVEREAFLRTVFLAVPVSCLRPSDRPTRAVRAALECSVGTRKQEELRQRKRRRRRANAAQATGNFVAGTRKDEERQNAGRR
jgi:hypothetical protein